MNNVFDTTDYGEIYLYQYANSCPGTGQYRGKTQGFPSHSKIEVRHTCCDCRPTGCGYWFYYMKGTGIWLDIGRTLAFEQHFQAFTYLLPDYKFTNTNNDLIELANAMRKQNYDTIQFLANNENSVFIYEILDARYKDELVSCPSSTQFIYQYSSKPYGCSCVKYLYFILKIFAKVNNECLNCKITNYYFQGQFPPCSFCTQYKYNSECLQECPEGTKPKIAYYSDEQFVCIYTNCNKDGCKECSVSGEYCKECNEGFDLKNGECMKPQSKVAGRIIINLFLLFFLIQ